MAGYAGRTGSTLPGPRIREEIHRRIWIYRGRLLRIPKRGLRIDASPQLGAVVALSARFSHDSGICAELPIAAPDLANDPASWCVVPG